MLHEHMFNTRTGSVFRVTDKNSNTFAAKVFSHLPQNKAASKAAQLIRFGIERAMLMKITKSVCPSFLDTPSTEEPVDITCDSTHLEILGGLDVDLIDKDGKELKSLMMNITSSQGDVTERRVDFTSNMLVPYMSGGRLGDVIDNTPSFKSITARYLAYTSIAPQLIEAVKRLHSLGIAHSGITPSTVYCSNPSCDEVTLGEFGRAYTDKNPLAASTQFVSEIAQDAVRFMTLDGSPKEGIDAKVIRKLSSYAAQPASWDAARTVDWFGLGGTLFYVVASSRVYIDSADLSRTSSRSVAEFVVKSMNERALINRVPDAQSRTVLSKIRDSVAEGLSLIDGLLAVDRSKRINFDTEEGRSRISTSLRANKAAMSVLQTEVRTAGSTCASFLHETRKIIPSMNAKQSMPSFLQHLC